MTKIIMKINENDWNFHFGSQHNGEPYWSDNKAMMAGRDTGHFGSGTYFSTYSSDAYDVRGYNDKRWNWINNGNSDPHFIQIEDHVYRVDLDLYKNLYRVRSKRQGDVLFTLLGRVNGFYNHIAYGGDFRPEYAQYDNALNYQKIYRNAKALNLKCPSYYDLTRMAQNHQGRQSFSTVFMEYNGYNGVNVSGIAYYDNTTHGSVIYDLSKINTTMEEVKPNSLSAPLDWQQSHSSAYVYDSDDLEMRAGNGDSEYTWFKADEINNMPIPKAMRILKNNIESRNVLGGYSLERLNDTLLSRYLRLLYTVNKQQAGDYVFYASDYKDKQAYLESIIKTKSFFWVNYKPSYYDRKGTGYTMIAGEMFWEVPYGKDRYKGRIEIMNMLKTYLNRELTDYENEFIEYNSKPDEFDENKKRKKNGLDERLTRTIDEIINEVEERSGNIGTYYHGGDISDDLWYNGVLWLTPEDYYAKEYAKIRKKPVIYEIKVDENKLFPGSIYRIFGDDGDPYEGPEKDEIPLLLDEGYNCYCMEYVDAEGLVLFNKDPIVSIRPLSPEEYEEVEEMED